MGIQHGTYLDSSSSHAREEKKTYWKKSNLILNDVLNRYIYIVVVSLTLIKTTFFWIWTRVSAKASSAE